MTEQTRDVEGCLPRNAQEWAAKQRCSCGRDSGRLQGFAPPQAGIKRRGSARADSRFADKHPGAVSHTSQPLCLSYDSAVETRTTVLIVDDHPSFRACARAILEADGFSVIGEAEDGQSALSALDSLTPDVVLLDVQLPDMDGFAVLERLGTGAPPVVLISSRDACDYDGMIRGSGARGFISKAELSGSAIRSLLR
jgi:CheY-like chemotaxis protein